MHQPYIYSHPEYCGILDPILLPNMLRAVFTLVRRVRYSFLCSKIYCSLWGIRTQPLQQPKCRMLPLHKEAKCHCFFYASDQRIRLFYHIEILARYEYILLALFKALPITKCIILSYIPIIST